MAGEDLMLTVTTLETWKGAGGSWRVDGTLQEGCDSSGS